MIYINDKEFDLIQEQPLSHVLETYALETGKGIAIAINNKIISRANWQDCIVKPNDKIIMIRATQGG
jgi:sulfur carrier protein